MTEYFLRRLLLTIPTFIGCTLVVFFIVQYAPGGPLEQQIQQLKARASEGGGSSGFAGQGETTIPKTALEELNRFYGFDKPVYLRYLIWLGLYPRETDSYKVVPGEARNVGEGRQVVVTGTATGGYKVFDAQTKNELTDWQIEPATGDTGSVQKARIFKTSVSGILQGNFGSSYEYREPVLNLIVSRMPISIQFGIIGFLLSYSVCIVLGIQKALRHGSKFDIVTSALVFVAYSVPGWALGSVLLVLLGTDTFLDILPLGDIQSSTYASMDFFEKIVDRMQHFVLPAIAYSIGGFATLTMLMKNSLLENLSQDYIRTAFAKGVRERRVIWLHAMRNSIIPIGARVGSLIGILLAESYLIELVFNINGLGKLSYMAILSRDYPIVFAFTVISVAILLIGSIISDLVLALIDPRIRFK